ncbi:MAG: SGNH/GDSL hydrolase family protein [Sphingopyxis sp.]|uniref:SGNH/GDSL hydrolase family protein n=1 Tax=Sphingopyxis sp. TaxID=1908224 RepID=UPI002AB80AA5|nr:SGNH/GDSL hydrolase family protein [Sphingopyxis sp.]MDZ3832807.1 SGNH/GDSL hydrolase family protein [Sphingopyxis sp.]
MRRRIAMVAAAWLAAVSPVHADEAERSILFVGNSFTQGANSAVLRYRPQSVDDLGGEGVGGIPALFARFAEQAGQKWRVAHATRGGATLADHIRDRLAMIERPWDMVVLQEYSTLDPRRPGNAEITAQSAATLARLLSRANPGVDVYLMATWSRADQVYRPEGAWYGRPVGQMARDLRAALDLIDRAEPRIDGVIPVGEAWTRAMETGVADPNPYDGIAFGSVDLWSYDQYHASAAGSYLEALVVFGRVSGIDPRRLGAGEKAAHEIGLDPRVAAALQAVAAAELGLAAEPAAP